MAKNREPGTVPCGHRRWPRSRRRDRGRKIFPAAAHYGVTWPAWNKGLHPLVVKISYLSKRSSGDLHDEKGERVGEESNLLFADLAGRQRRRGRGQRTPGGRHRGVRPGERLRDRRHV